MWSLSWRHPTNLALSLRKKLWFSTFLHPCLNTSSVFLTHQVFFRHKNWHPKCFLTHQVFFKVQFPLVSSLLELQSKSWVLELKLEPSALQELSQSCSSDSTFRKGLPTGKSLTFFTKCQQKKLRQYGQTCGDQSGRGGTARESSLQNDVKS